jgi:hypothetical protein
MSEHPFFLSESALHLNEPDLMRDLLSALPHESAALYELTFHSSFAKKMFTVLKREGPNVQGFERMQHSFQESIEKVRLQLEQIENDHEVSTSELLSNSREANARLVRLIDDLTAYKEWQNHQDND